MKNRPYALFLNNVDVLFLKDVHLLIINRALHAQKMQNAVKHMVLRYRF